MPKRVLVQAGHNPPREPGFEGGTGTAGEIDFVKDVADHLLAILKRDSRFEGIYSPGDIPDGIQVHAALFLHADGSASPAASGYSFGSPQTVHGVRSQEPPTRWLRTEFGRGSRRVHVLWTGP